jgi:hypothetical protein
LSPSFGSTAAPEVIGTQSMSADPARIQLSPPFVVRMNCPFEMPKAFSGSCQSTAVRPPSASTASCHSVPEWLGLWCIVPVSCAPPTM